MNDLDRLRDDLHAEPDVPFGPPDLAAVMSTGRRIRRRRQVTATVATGLAVVAVTGVVFSLARPPATSVQPAAPASAGPSVIVTPSVTDPPPTPAPTPGTETQTIRTGVQMQGGEFALLVEVLAEPGKPGVLFHFRTGVVLGNGDVDSAISLGEYGKTELTPGFHGNYQTTTVGGNRVPMFGFYSGKATRITGQTIDGETVEATLSKAVVDGNEIILFWFDPATAGPGSITGTRAYDANGTQLPTGNNTPTRG